MLAGRGVLRFSLSGLNARKAPLISNGNFEVVD
jgi:hypothetical protein